MDGCQVGKDGGPPCGQPGTLIRMACVHEHVADGWICEEHEALNLGWMCQLCEDADGHHCPLTVIRVP